MVRFQGTWVFVYAALSLAQIGCDDTYHDGPRIMGQDRISPRARWRVSGELQGLERAVDGNLATAAVSGANYDGATLTIDLGKVCQFNMIAVEHGPDEYGFCRKMAVLVSEDGGRFHRQAAVPGLRRVTTAVFAKQVLARYIRLQAAEQGDRPWSVAEIYLN